MGHLRLWSLAFAASVFSAPTGASVPELPACHLGGCAADAEGGGGGGALSLLQAEGTKAAAAIRRRHLQQLDIGGQPADDEVDPFASLVQVHQETLETVWRVSASSRARSVFAAAVVLPVLGFAATLLAIAATVVVETRASAVVAECQEGAPGRAPFTPHGEVILFPGSIYKGLRSLVMGDQPPKALGPASKRSAAAHRKPPGAEGLLTHQTPTGGTLGAGSYSPSFGEHLNLLPPADQGAMTSAVGSQVLGDAVLVPHPLEGGRLGLKVTDDTLEITGFYDERAQSFGFRLGDRILKVNGVSVSGEQDFLQQVARALELNRTGGDPLAFTVLHQGPQPGAAFGGGPEQPLALPPRTAPPRTAPPAAPLAAPAARAMAREESAASVHYPTSPAPAHGQRVVEEPPPAPPRPPGFSSSALAKSAAMLGSWVYSDEDGPNYNYQISREASGLLLRFSQQVPEIGVVAGTLSPEDDIWYKGTLSLSSGMGHGSIRLRHDADRDEMISYLMMKGASSWGEEVRSQRLHAPASQPSPTPPRPAASGRYLQAGTPLALPFASVPGSPASLQAYDHGTPPSHGVLTLPETHS